MTKHIIISNGIDEYMVGPASSRHSVRDNLVDVFDDMVHQFLDRGDDAMCVTVEMVDMTDDEVASFEWELTDD